MKKCRDSLMMLKYLILSDSEPQYLVVAVKMPNGQIELITNTRGIGEKVEYYLNTYDENMHLKHNKDVEVVEVWYV